MGVPLPRIGGAGLSALPIEDEVSQLITLGITGSFADLPGTFMPEVPEWLFHDSAAAVVIDGTVVAAVEEERLNRIKHTNKFPSLAARECLRLVGAQPEDVDEVAFFFGEDYADLEVLHEYLRFPEVPTLSARDLLSLRLSESLGREFEQSDIHFVKHHVAHGFGALSDSGYDSALVVVIDGNGETESVSVFHGQGSELELLRSFPTVVSLGHLYLALLPLMGFRRFDEYKVMGLAPYGDPAVYRGELHKFYSLSPNGRFTVDSTGALEHLLRVGFRPRRRDEAIRQQDSDLAAALQESLEAVQFHLLRYWARETGARNLCLSGGVAQNSSANGKVLRSNIFDRVFVHPASHDAGASAGAAQHRQAMVTGQRKGRRLVNAFLGPALGGSDELRDELGRWQAFVEAESLERGEEASVAAAAIAGGEVIGWASGRSEFGPRALGHRSILADPRQAENRDRVNAMIKKREGFRPFAPAVLVEHAGSVFDLAATEASLEFMSYVVDVRPEWRERLPAVTHVDGSARVQTVAQDRNPSLWRILTAFHELTGVPVLLNTSFNNFAEPIVQSARDVLRCLVTTKLDGVIVPGYLVRRRADLIDAVLNATVTFHPAAEVRKYARPAGGRPAVELIATFQYAGSRSLPVSPELFSFLLSTGESATSLAKIGLAAATPNRVPLAEELLGLWEHRVVDLAPPAVPGVSPTR